MDDQHHTEIWHKLAHKYYPKLTESPIETKVDFGRLSRCPAHHSPFWVVIVDSLLVWLADPVKGMGFYGTSKKVDLKVACPVAWPGESILSWHCWLLVWLVLYLAEWVFKGTEFKGNSLYLIWWWLRLGCPAYILNESILSCRCCSFLDWSRDPSKCYGFQWKLFIVDPMVAQQATLSCTSGEHWMEYWFKLSVFFLLGLVLWKGVCVSWSFQRHGFQRKLCVVDLMVPGSMLSCTSGEHWIE